jgi:hypothetical protein
MGTKKCRYADKYKAIFPPKCNGGDPCDECARKWEEAEERRRENG